MIWQEKRTIFSMQREARWARTEGLPWSEVENRRSKDWLKEWVGVSFSKFSFSGSEHY